MSEDRVVAKQRIKDARRLVDDLPMLEMEFRGVPIGYFNSQQLIKILGNLTSSYETERNNFHAALRKAGKWKTNPAHLDGRATNDTPRNQRPAQSE